MTSGESNASKKWLSNAFATFYRPCLDSGCWNLLFIVAMKLCVLLVIVNAIQNACTLHTMVILNNKKRQMERPRQWQIFNMEIGAVLSLTCCLFFTPSLQQTNKQRGCISRTIDKPWKGPLTDGKLIGDSPKKWIIKQSKNFSNSNILKASESGKSALLKSVLSKSTVFVLIAH